MARFVEDLRLTLPLLAGVDWRDPGIVPMPLGDPQSVDLKSLRVAFHTDNGIVSAHPCNSCRCQEDGKRAVCCGSRCRRSTPQMVSSKPMKSSSPVISADGGAGIQMLLRIAGTTEVHPLTGALARAGAPHALSTMEFSAFL